MTGKIHTAVLILFAATALGDPVDTAYDLMDAIEYGDGYALEGLLTEDLYSAVNSYIHQVRGIIETDPALAEDLLNSRYNGSITIADFEAMNNREILGLAMNRINLQPLEQVESEEAQLEGRSARVVIRYFNGSSISFRMSWENSSWRIADTSLLEFLFN